MWRSLTKGRLIKELRREGKRRPRRQESPLRNNVNEWAAIPDNKRVGARKGELAHYKKDEDKGASAHRHLFIHYSAIKGRG